MKKEILFLSGMYLIPLASAFINPGQEPVAELGETKTANMLFVGGIVFALLLSVIIYFAYREKETKKVVKKKNR
jgi:hypothetical protein